MARPIYVPALLERGIETDDIYRDFFAVLGQNGAKPERG
jgi:hypothetical protein